MAAEQTGPTVETTHNTRQPTLLAVLLAGAGSPPLDPEGARNAAIRLFDGFFLAPERRDLFCGSPTSLFPEVATVVDPRHDALGRLLRLFAAGLRSRLESYESGGRELLRNIPALSAARLEGVFAGYDPRRAAPIACTAEAWLGSSAPLVDPLEANDAGVLRRLVALCVRGMMAEKPRRGVSVINDLGAVTVLLVVLDLAANPRSALRAVRTRLAKAGRLEDDDTARLLDAAHALRDLLTHAVAGATPNGAAGRELVRESALPSGLLEHFVSALARTVYDGLGPDDEHPLTVPGAERADALTFAPLLDHRRESGSVSPTLGLYNRLAFVPLPYARWRSAPHVTEVPAVAPSPPPAAPSTMRAPRPSGSRPAIAIDEQALKQAREQMLTPLPLEHGWPVLEARIDPADPTHTWKPLGRSLLGERVVHAALREPASMQWLMLVGPRDAQARSLLDSVAQGLVGRGPWHVLSPRVSDASLGFEPLATESAALTLRRADLDHWLDAQAPRRVHYDLDRDARVVLYVSLPEGERLATALPSLVALVRDVTDKVDLRALLVVVGVADYGVASRVLSALACEPALEDAQPPLRAGSVRLLRTDGLLRPELGPDLSPEESVLALVASSFTSNPALVQWLCRGPLLGADRRPRAHLMRLAALGPRAEFNDARRVLERATEAPWEGAQLRRALQSGVATLPTLRAAICAGQVHSVMDCLRHELELVLAEWELARSPSSRGTDLARGMFLEHLLAAAPNAVLFAQQSWSASLEKPEYFDNPGHFDTLHQPGLGLRVGGTLYQREDPRTIVALGVGLRGAALELDVLVDFTQSVPATRPTRAPWLELVWTGNPGELVFGALGLWVASLYEPVRRYGSELPWRVASRDGRTAAALLVDVALDSTLQPVSVRLTVPLRAGATESDAQRLALELAGRVGDNLGLNQPTSWGAATQLEPKGASIPILVDELLLSRELVSRWWRALRSLPRWLPTATGLNDRFGEGALFASAAELGLPRAVLEECRMEANSVAGRAVAGRLDVLVGDVIGMAREVAALLPVKSAVLEGGRWEVVERVLQLGWFFQANLCSSHAGNVQWAPEKGDDVRALVERFVDRRALNTWAERKGPMPAGTRARLGLVAQLFEPSMVVKS